MPKVKIISDGTMNNTKIIDEKTGQLLAKVQKVTWITDVNEPLSKCIIELIGVPLEVSNTNITELVYKNSKTIELSKEEIFRQFHKILNSKLNDELTVEDLDKFVEFAKKVKEIENKKLENAVPVHEDEDIEKNMIESKGEKI